MKNIIQLVELISPNKLKEIALIRTSGDAYSKVDLLYQRLIKGNTNDVELKEELFGRTSNIEKNFNRLKNQLENRLINSLFLIDANLSKYQEIDLAYYACYKYAAAVKILLGKNARIAAIDLAEKTYKIAEKFEFIDVLLTLSKDLRIHYGTIAGNKKLYNYYDNKVKIHSKTLMAELKAEEYYTDIALNFSISRAAKKELLIKATEYAEELKMLIEQYSAYRLNFVSYNVMAIRYEIAHDYQNNLNLCNQALNFFNQRKHITSNNALHTFYFRKISSLILLGEFLEAEDTSNICIELDTLKSHNWYQTQVYRYIIFLHSDQYEKAYQVYKEAIGHSNFSKQYPNIKEAWYIYEAYTYYLCLKKAINAPLNNRLKKFRLNKFLNEIPSYSKDKRGMNISVLILQILFLLHQKEYGKIIDRVEALRTYTHRYLRKDATFRSNCFIKMLLQLPNANFHKVAVERKTASLRKKLSSVGIINNQSAELEIIPYEMLWEFVMDSLEKKIR